MKKYSWDFDQHAERWGNDSCDTVEECIKDAVEAIKELDLRYDEIPTVVYIGENVGFNPQVDAEIVLERLEEQASDDFGEFGDDWDAYDPKKKDQLEELSDALTKVVADWFEKYGYTPYFWMVEDVKEYPLPKEGATK